MRAAKANASPNGYKPVSHLEGLHAARFAPLDPEEMTGG
jgi:hypothetical protein